MCSYFASYLLDRGGVSLKFVNSVWPVVTGALRIKDSSSTFLFYFFLLPSLFVFFLPLIHNSLYFMVCLHALHQMCALGAPIQLIQ